MHPSLLLPDFVVFWADWRLVNKRRQALYALKLALLPFADCRAQRRSESSSWSESTGSLPVSMRTASSLRTRTRPHSPRRYDGAVPWSKSRFESMSRIKRARRSLRELLRTCTAEVQREMPSTTSDLFTYMAQAPRCYQRPFPAD